MSDAYSRPEMPDITQLKPATGGVGAPASGTYGEGAPMERLRETLPAPTPQGAPAAASRPIASGGPLPLPPPSGALPAAIGAPSTRPYEPMATPLSQPIPVGETPSAQTRQIVEAWARDPNLHETTRAWAQSILDRSAR